MISRGQHRARSWGRLGTAVVAAAGSAAGLVIAFGAPNASAAGEIPAGSACEAKGVALGAAVIAHANPPTTPCVAHTATAVPIQLGGPGLFVGVGVIRSRTIVTFPPNRVQFNAASNVANLQIQLGTLVIRAGVLRAQAQGSNNGRNKCYAGGQTYVGTIIIGSSQLVIGSTPTHIPLPLGLALDLNKETFANGGVQEKALVLTSTVGNVTTDLLTVAEAQMNGGCSQIT
jgi:hypothetical protein